MLMGYDVYDRLSLACNSFTTKAFEMRVKQVVEQKSYVGRALDLNIHGLAPRVPNSKSTIGIYLGAVKRYLAKPPLKVRIGDFKRFVRNLLHTCFTPLAYDTDLSYGTFREEGKWPEWRKVQLDAAQAKLPFVSDRQVSRIKSFVKVEAFEEFKYPRIINARCDLAKVKFGPMIHAIEKEVYKDDWFAKHIPVADRPRVIQSRFGRWRNILASDYTSFESLMDAQMMDCCETQLYRYMMKNVPGGRKLADDYVRMLTGINKPQSRYTSVKTVATRMSGEMSTSLGNGFTNVCAIVYILWNKMGRPKMAYQGVGFWESFSLLVEGDDALVGYNCEDPTVEEFAEVGLKAKIEKHHSVEDSRFCQLAYSKHDLEPLCNIKRTLAKTFYSLTAPRFARQSRLKPYMRGKGLCLAYEFPGCPIVRSVAKCLLRLTNGVVAKFERDKFNPPDEKSALAMLDKHTIGFASRLLIEQEQKIPVAAQLVLEEQFDNCNTCGEMILDVPIITPDDYAFYLKNTEPLTDDGKLLFSAVRVM